MPVNDKIMLKTNNTAMLVARKSKMRIIDEKLLNKTVIKTRLAIMAAKREKSSMPMNSMRKNVVLLGKKKKSAVVFNRVFEKKKGVGR